MQTIEALKTIKWISSLYSQDTQQMLFTGAIFGPIPERDAAERILTAGHEVSRLRSTLLAHPFATQVLEAFHLIDLIDEEWPIRVSSLARSERETVPELHNMLMGMMKKWSEMTNCVGPLEKLTTPSEVIDEKDFDEIWTIDIRSEKEITVDSLSKVFTHTDELYDRIAQLMGIAQVEKLRVIYVASGSSKRFDMRGLGEVIKQVKEFIIELWHQIRYRRIEDSHMNNNAILDSLNVLREIEAHREKNTLSDEEAAQIRVGVLKSALILLDQGALIREIPAVETVANQQLLEDRQQRLLPAPEE